MSNSVKTKRVLPLQRTIPVVGGFIALANVALMVLHSQYYHQVDQYYLLGWWMVGFLLLTFGSNPADNFALGAVVVFLMILTVICTIIGILGFIPWVIGSIILMSANKTPDPHFIFTFFGYLGFFVMPAFIAWGMKE